MTSREKVENFLYREARLMDEHAYDEWLSLWADDGLYWIPCNDDDADPLKSVTIIYDDKTQLTARIDRLKSGSAWAQEPRSRMRRVVSNVEIGNEAGKELTVYSNFVLHELRRGKIDRFGGRSIHRLRLHDDSFKIVQKKVLLVENDEAIDNLTFFL
jgi:benzoate/toluate 1,2-dioxygenase subunit beta